MEGWVVVGLSRREAWRGWFCSRSCRSDVDFSFSVSGSQLCSIAGIEGCGGPCCCWL